MIEYVYSLNDDEYYDLESILDQIEDEDNIVEIYKAEKKPYLLTSCIYGRSILEEVSQNIYDNVGDFGEDYCNAIDNISVAKIRELEQSIIDFIIKEVGQPRFLQIKTAVKIQVKDILGTGHTE